MKKIHWSAMVTVGFVMAATVVIAATGCASGVRMTTSHEIPAAQGAVKASPTDNDNTLLEIEVRHLAPPAKVALGATTYVVWARAAGQDTPQNLGALSVDKNLRGTLKTLTPLRSFDVFITAERSPTTIIPTNGHLLTASIKRQGG